jgi:ubiquinone/menaquinone biosynthesis C-methylase UbiE
MIPEFFNNEKEHIKSLIEKYQIDKYLHVLDVGCSDFKLYSEYVASYFSSYTGVDIDEKALEIARKKSGKYQNAKIEFGSAENLKYIEGSFDLVIFNNAIAYTDKQKAYSEAYRVLKPNGLFLSCFNNTIEYSFYKLIHPMKPLLVEWGHTFVVILNTWIYSVSGLKIFRTTFNTRKELAIIIKSLGANLKEIEVENKTHPYRVINIVAQKGASTRKLP